jgi:hypothetical protein
MIRKILSILLFVVLFQSFAYSQIVQDKKAVAAFNLKPNLKPKIISQKIDFQIYEGDTLIVWSNSTKRFHRIFVGGKWGWVSKDKVVIIENIVEKEKVEQINDLPINAENNSEELTPKDYPEAIQETKKDTNTSIEVLEEEDIPFITLLLWALIAIGVSNYVIPGYGGVAASLLSLFVFWAIFPNVMSNLFWILVIMFIVVLLYRLIYGYSKNKDISVKRTPPVPSYEINSYTKDEICDLLVGERFKWNGYSCKMENVAPGTVWVIERGWISGSKLIRANTLYKHELLEIYRDIFGEQEPPPGYNIREPISQRIKDQVWKRDEGECVKCGSNIDLEYDHIKPVSAGGKSTYRNLQLLCENCNRSKGAKIE